MSAIFGLVELANTPLDDHDCAALAAALACWSAQPATTLRAGAAALGCVQLRTTPESLHEVLPWQHPRSGLVITADARLDNRPELLAALGLTGEDLTGQGRDVSDSELILHGYLRWGQRCPQYLLGDFAFAIWNPATGDLFCARDHMGGKPFCYTRCNNFFAFSSSPEALLELPWTSNKLEQKSLANLLVFAFEDLRENATWYADIDALPPGHSLRIAQCGREELICYWRPSIGSGNHFACEEEAREAFREVFGRAVRDRLRSIDPPALLLSGGMDSSAIAATVANLTARDGLRPCHTYSVISDRIDDCIESRCIEALTLKSCFLPRFLKVPSITGLLDANEIFQLAWDKSHPVDSDILLQSALIQSAGREGHRVMLHGTSGDLTLWSSRQYIALLLKAGNWRRAWRESRQASDHHTYYFGHPPLELLAYNLYHAFAPALVRTALWKLRSIRHDRKTYGFLNQAFVRSLGLADYFRHYRGRRHRLGLGETHNEDLLRQMVNIVSALGGANRLGGRHGVEMRDPFGDRRMVDFFLQLPEEYKVRNGWTKYLPRTAFPEQLPDFLRFRRGKESLARQVHLAAMNHDPAFIDSAMACSVPLLYPYLDSDHIQTIYKGHRRGDPISSRRLYDHITWARWLERIAAMPTSG